MWKQIPALLFFAGALSACSAAMFVPEHQETPPPPVNLVIEVSGTPGLGFEGSLGTANASRSIEGQVPAQFTVETAVAVVANVTKKQEDGELTVRVLRAGQEVTRRTTSAPFGNILLIYTPR